MDRQIAVRHQHEMRTKWHASRRFSSDVQRTSIGRMLAPSHAMAISVTYMIGVVPSGAPTMSPDLTPIAARCPAVFMTSSASSA